LKKRSKKLLLFGVFALVAAAAVAKSRAKAKSFLLLFFKKEALSFSGSG
jgi:hypothetical protein